MTSDTKGTSRGVCSSDSIRFTNVEKCISVIVPEIYDCFFPLQLLAECITITIACKLRAELNPQVQATWQKFLSAVVEAMSSQYK